MVRLLEYPKSKSKVKICALADRGTFNRNKILNRSKQELLSASIVTNDGQRAPWSKGIMVKGVWSKGHYFRVNHGQRGTMVKGVW